MINPEVKANLKSYLSDKEIKVLEKVYKRKEYEDYFFRTKKDLKWFYPFKILCYFSPEKAPRPIPAETDGVFAIPNWNVLPYLERVSEQVNIPENEGYIDDLLNIIREVTQYHVSHDKCLDNYRTWWYFAKILLNLPNNRINPDIVELVSVWLDSKFYISLQGADIAEKLLPKFLDSDEPEDWKKAEKIVEIITDIRWIPLPEKEAEVFRKKEEPKTLLDAYWLLESFKVNASKVGEKCSEKVILTLADRLKEIIGRGRDKNDYTYIWFKSLFSNVERTGQKADATLIIILRDILKEKAIKDREKTMVVLNQFRSDAYPYPIFRRMVLFAIGIEWERYKKLFWDIVERGDCFDDPNYRSELYMILKNNISRFTIEEKEKIKSIIEQGPLRYLSEEDREKDIANWKQEWYSAVKTDSYFALLYEEQRNITQVQE